MVFEGQFVNESNVAVPGSFYLNDTLVSSGDSSFSVQVTADTPYTVSFVPDDNAYFTYNQAFLFPLSALLPQFIGVLGLVENPAPICNFYAVQAKCSTEVFVWHAASSPYTNIEWTWWENGDMKVTTGGGSSSHVYKVFGEVEIKQKVTVCEPIEGGNENSECGCGTVVLTNCTHCETSQIFTVLKRIPEVTLTMVCSDTEESGIDCSCGCNEVSACKCIPINKSVVIKLAIAQNNEQCCYENGFEIIGCDPIENGFTVDSCQSQPDPPATDCFTELPPVYIQGEKTTYNLSSQTIDINGQVDFSGANQIGIFWQANFGSGWVEIFQTNYTNTPSPLAITPAQFGNINCQASGITQNLNISSYTNGSTIYSSFNLLSLQNIFSIDCINGVLIRFGAQACNLTQFVYSDPITIIYQP